MRRKSEAGFFLWEALLAGLLLLIMVGSAALYVKAAELKNIAAQQATALYLGRAQISYAQGRLNKEGVLPSELPYQGKEADLGQNGCSYQLRSYCQQEAGGWQLQVEISWEVRGHEEKLVFVRWLAPHSQSKGDNPL